MPLQEIDANTVAIPRLPPPLNIGKRKRGGSNPDKNKGKGDISDALRSSVVILRVFNHDAYEDICDKTGVAVFTAFRIVREAKATAQSDDFVEIVVCFSKKERPGLASFISETSEDSVRLRAVILRDSTTEWHQVVKREGFKIARLTVENVAKRHRDSQHSYVIKWAIRSAKPHLSLNDEEIRLEYCHWALQRLKEGAIFIFIDESYVDVGGPPRKKAKASRSVGDCAEAIAISTPSVQFSVMLWGGICEDEFIQRSSYIWVLPESDEDRKKHNQELKEENTVIRIRCEKQQQRARDSTRPHIQKYSDL